MKRDKYVDLMKGFLIVLVVIGHSDIDFIHDAIFLFHMPLFFVLSGYLHKEKMKLSISYLKNIMIRYMIPYISYLVIVWVAVDRDFSLSYILRLVYGGRAVKGTYWYMTCLVFAFFLFTFLRSKFRDNTTKILILAGGG